MCWCSPGRASHWAIFTPVDDTGICIDGGWRDVRYQPSGHTLRPFSFPPKIYFLNQLLRPADVLHHLFFLFFSVSFGKVDSNMPSVVKVIIGVIRCAVFVLRLVATRLQYRSSINNKRLRVICDTIRLTFTPRHWPGMTQKDHKSTNHSLWWVGIGRRANDMAFKILGRNKSYFITVFFWEFRKLTSLTKA